MENYVVLALFLTFVSLSTAKPSSAEYRHKVVCYEKIGCFSLLNGTFKDIKILKFLPDSPEQIGTKFKLFTKNNKEACEELDPLAPETLNTPLVNPNVTTVFVVHGFAVEEDPGQWFITKAFLDNLDCQVIVVDWRLGSQPPAYWQAVVNAELVGRQLGHLVKTLVDQRAFQPDRVHIYGSSLGAHVAGFAGKWTRSKYGFTVGRISASDPAAPFLEDSTDSVHVSHKDATFVDVIHTSAGDDVSKGQLGLVKAVGHVDFYPNGGTLQKGCVEGDPVCSHLRADYFYAESLENNPACSFKSYPCPGGYQDFQKSLCRDCGSDGCSRMGYRAINFVGRGKQYLDTNAGRPFCME